MDGSTAVIRQRAIGDFAAIGDAHTVALVAANGAVEWCCLPRFDSPAVFLRMLDEEHGGHFRVGPSSPCATTRRYVPGTNVLETTFETARGAARLTDAMPWVERSPLVRAPHAIVRSLEVLGGEVSIAVEFAPTFDFGRVAHRIERCEHGVVVSSEHGALALIAPDTELDVDASGARGFMSLRVPARARFTLAFASTADRAVRAARDIDPDRAIEGTIAAWQRWSARCTYEGPYADAVRRSALVLKLLTYAPTGALVAAPTTSLPESPGGVRNWDYRYAWLRDASLTVSTLMALGYHDESLRYLDWIESLCIACGCDELRIAYAVDGAAVPVEVPLNHLAGFGGARPVRVGNGARDQIQLDVLGEVIDAAYTCHASMQWRRPRLWNVLRTLADRAARSWREPDAGIWEMRGPPAHHLHSKLLCWVALDRAVRFARETGSPEDATWARERDAIRSAILDRGYDAQRGAFTQSFGSRALDASALRIPLVGFLPATDPRLVSTVRRIEQELAENGFVLRYRASDGLPPGEGAFALCTLWLASVLARMGDEASARRHLEAVLGAANDVGLLAEEIDPRNRTLLGNFPQALTHLGIIDVAVQLRSARVAAR
jgi:GH15 family glucan-1,4-alpha-glucosidase